MNLLDDLEVFQELARHGSFSAVARLRSQAPSSIARRLDRLEAHLGRRLFNRVPKGLFLTQAGHRKLAQARELTVSAQAFEQDGDAGGRGPASGSVSLSAPAKLGEVCIAPLAARFLREHPQVCMDLHLTNAFQDLDLERIDIAVRIGAQAAEHYIMRKIAANRRILVAAPAYLKQAGRIASPEDLNRCDGLLSGQQSGWLLRNRNGRRVFARPRRRMGHFSGDVMAWMAAAGLGVALKSEWEVAGDLRSGRLQRILPGWEQADVPDIVLVTPSRRLVPRAVRLLGEAVETGLGEMLAGGKGNGRSGGI